MGKILFLLKRIWNKILSVLNTSACKSQITATGNVQFGSKARVYNIRKDPSKIKIAANTFVNAELTVYKHGGDIDIGEYCFIGEGTRIWSAKKITIGNRVLIAHNVSIHDCNDHPIDAKLRHEHYKTMMSTGHPDQIDLEEREITIEDDAWIGFGAIILKGVTIGKGAVVAAGSVVTKNVSPNTIVAGNPAKMIKEIPNKA